MSDVGGDVLGPADAEDIYLEPHSDDACFSLGALASARGRGTLLTVFARAAYVAGVSRRDPRRIDEVTRIRLDEGARFAAECGLDHLCLPFEEAMARGHPAFAPEAAPQVARTIERALIDALRALRLGRRPSQRPWLFCPAGIGDHVDHLAVAQVIASHAAPLSEHYRIAWYEDLHYARDGAKRTTGIARLARLLEVGGFRRVALALDERAQARKLALVRLYASQLTPAIDRLEAYTPDTGDGAGPHEALLLPTAAHAAQRQ